jgi:hypothetical protein
VLGGFAQQFATVAPALEAALKADAAEGG